jgi:hypothetical protein
LFVGLGLFRLETRSDVVGDIDIGNIDGENFKGGGGIDSFFENEAGDRIRVFKNALV